MTKFQNLSQLVAQKDRTALIGWSKDGFCALYWLLRQREFETASKLVELVGVNVENSSSGLPTLHEMVKSADRISIEWLLEHGADANGVPDQDAPPLYYAALLNRPDAAALLLEYGAIPTWRMAGGSSILEACASHEVGDLVLAAIRRARAGERGTEA